MALKSVSDWHSLGVHLDLKSHHLDTIEKNHRGDDERCRTETLNSWLKNTTTPTWEAIVEALGRWNREELQMRYKENISFPMPLQKVQCPVYACEL